LKKPQPQLDDEVKNVIASEVAELFFQFWQNRRSELSKQEVEAVAPNAGSSEDSRILEQQP